MHQLHFTKKKDSPSATVSTTPGTVFNHPAPSTPTLSPYVFSCLICPRSNVSIKNPVVIVETAEYCDANALDEYEKKREGSYFYPNRKLKEAIDWIDKIELLMTEEKLSKEKKEEIESLSKYLIEEILIEPINYNPLLHNPNTTLRISQTGATYPQEIINECTTSHKDTYKDPVDHTTEHPISALSDNILLKEFLIEMPKWESNLKERIQAKSIPTLEYR